ncbi:MAG: zinc-ribbon domain-containing protein [Deltaproteobacteria bacterium]|nr:zinc-ribbon domain-containing protein [Deltaproteobacteria bacterium]
MICKNCNKQNDDGARFCNLCGAEISAAPELKLQKMPVIGLIFYAIITFGIYIGVWFIKKIEILNALNSDTKLSQGVFGFIIAGLLVNIGIILYLIFSGAFIELEADGLPVSQLARNLLAISDALALAVQVLILIQAFRVRRILIDHHRSLGTEIVISWIALIFFGVFYLQYKINRLEPVKGGGLEGQGIHNT